jgi:hypothetical protein
MGNFMEISLKSRPKVVKSGENRKKLGYSRAETGKKKCGRCGTVRDMREFGSNSTSSDGRQSYCRHCRNDVHNKRRKTDLSHRIRHHFCTRITKQCQLNGFKVPDRLFYDLERYLGYGLWQLRKHLEAELKGREGPEMSLREAILEMGYHIDHIRPLSSWRIPPDEGLRSKEFRECWSIKNLRAISAKENLAKGAKITAEAQITVEVGEQVEIYADGRLVKDVEDVEDAA